MDRFTTLLLILCSLFFGLFIYLFNPHGATLPVQKSEQVLSNLFSRDISVVLAGDIMLGRGVNIASLNRNDPTYPFKNVADFLRSQDIVFGNLESPIVENCPRIERGYTFCADPKMAKGLVAAGIGVVSLANNHIRNFGEKGLEDTKRILNENGILWVGEENLEIVEKRGIKYGFLGFDFVSKKPKEEDYQLVRDSDKKADVLIVGVHWGEEYKGKAGKNEEGIAKKLTEAGADAVAGHHPHWVQNDEKISGRPVYYSLGNFVFDQMWSEETRKGLLVKLTYRDGELKSEEKFPIYIPILGQPKITSFN